MKESQKDIIKNLTIRDIEALKSIYYYRCLTQAQLYALHYKYSPHRKNHIVSDTYCHKKIYTFLSLKLIEKEETPNFNIVYFLTPIGIEIVCRYSNFPTNIYDQNKKIVKRGYYRASELKINVKNINHQISLNQFVLDFKQKFPQISHRYYDEKYVSQFSSIRPDGLLTVYDTDYFLEMDMSTESKKQLIGKWDNYRRFLNSREYSYKERKIVVLFIIDNPYRIQERIDLVKYTIYESLLDVVQGKEFEIYVGSTANILDLLEKRLLPVPNNFTEEITHLFQNRYQFDVSSGDKLSPITTGIEYELYAKKINRKGKVVIEHNRIQEYLIDNYLYAPVSVIHKIAYLNKYNRLFFELNFKRKLPYIVIVESEQQIYRDLKLMDLTMTDNVYFTTMQRLNTLPFEKALFQFDGIGNVYSFLNSGLIERTYDQSVAPK